MIHPHYHSCAATTRAVTAGVLNINSTVIFSVLCLLSGQEYSIFILLLCFTELYAALRAGVLNIHITVIFTVLCAALWAGVLNIHITVIFPELYATLRAGVLNIHITVIFSVLCLLSGQEYSILI